MADKDPEWGEKNPPVFRVKKEPNGGYRVFSSPDIQDVSSAGQPRDPASC